MNLNSDEIKKRKKMIEVSIPLEAINEASAREKTIRQGHPSTLHLWWARRPLAAARAIIFCQLVDDPSSVPEEFPTENDQERERLRLFSLISKLVQWKNSNNEEILKEAHEEIRKTWLRFCRDNKNHPEAKKKFNPKEPPEFHDPFAGGGAIPLEAQRLGLVSHASDLNPVAVVINKATTEIPFKLKGLPSIYSSTSTSKQQTFLKPKSEGCEGLAKDVISYGQWIYDEAQKSLGNFYPKIKVSAEIVNKRPDLKAYENKNLNIIAWIWARTVKSPNPAFSHVDVPLVSTFMLSTKKGKEAYIQPILEDNTYLFSCKIGNPKEKEQTQKGTSAGKRAGFRCLMTGDPISYDYIRSEGMAGQIGSRLMAVVAEGTRERIYLDPTPEQESAAKVSNTAWEPNIQLQGKCRVNVSNYGMDVYSDLFTNRQLFALDTFSGLIKEVKNKVRKDALYAFSKINNTNNQNIEDLAEYYSNAICVFLSCSIDKLVDYNSTITSWGNSRQTIRNTFGRQAIPMVWDYAEANILSRSTGGFLSCLNQVGKVILDLPGSNQSEVRQADASTQNISKNKIISTDPPYYDNIAYADLSDYFYVWMRRSLKDIYPELFATRSTPKAEELVATTYRHSNKSDAEKFFLNGMAKAMQQLSNQMHPGFPLTIYYAFKQSEIKGTKNISRTGWETFLAAIFKSNLSIIGTWPIRTEMATRMVGADANALASSIVLVCEKKKSNAKVISRKDFRSELRKQLPKAIKSFEKTNIAAVDIAQAAIGPGMAIFSQAKSVFNPDDSSMTVNEAIGEINAILDEHLSQIEGDLDKDSRFALTFYENFGYSERPFGDAEGLAKARNVSVEGIVKAGILKSVGGKVNLIKRENLPQNWDPLKDDRLSVWEATQYLIRTLETEGEFAASKLLNTLKNISGFGNLATSCRSIAYRLYNHCEKNNQFEEARSYNSLIISWLEIEKIYADKNYESKIQTNLF